MKVEILEDPTFEQVLFIAENMRERDREEIYATRYGEDPAEVARDVMRAGDFKWIALVDGTPVAAWGAYPRWPGVWTGWAFGTDDWPKAVRAVTRHVRRFMLPGLYHAGAHRVDCLAYAGHTDARDWLDYLGAKPEKPLDNWGKNGETFVCYVWTREPTKQIMEKSKTI